MAEPAADRASYCFDDLQVDTAAHRVTRSGLELPLEPKAHSVLVALLRRAGEVVTRDQLLDEVWGHRHVTDGALTRVVSQLRVALRDHAEEPRYISTVHTLGYRFIGRLRPDAPAPAVAASASTLPAADTAVTNADALASKDSYAVGRRYWWERTPASLAEALHRFQHSLRLDPRNARACCGIADCCLLLYKYGRMGADSALVRARGAIATALDLEPDLAEAYAAQGLLELQLQHFELAASCLKLAVALDPGLLQARTWLAMALTLQGRLDEGQAMLVQAAANAPDNVALLAAQSLGFVLQGRWNSAEQVLVGIRRLNPGYLEGYWQAAWCRAQHGRLAAAWDMLREADAVAGPHPWTRRCAAHLACMLGLPSRIEVGDESDWEADTLLFWGCGQWRRAIERLSALDPHGAERAQVTVLLAHSLASAGRRDEALGTYESAYRGEPSLGDTLMRPWDYSMGLGERANHVALMDPDHPRRQARLAGLSAQLERLREGGMRLPALAYHQAVLHALAFEPEAALACLDAALAEGYVDAMALDRELAWSGFSDAPGLALRRERLEAAAEAERGQIEHAPPHPGYFRNTDPGRLSSDRRP